MRIRHALRVLPGTLLLVATAIACGSGGTPKSPEDTPADGNDAGNDVEQNDHSSESDAAPWVQLLLERVGVPASEAAALIAAALITTTGALRALHSRRAEWDAFLDPLSAAVASELGVEREDARQALIEGFDEALEAVQIKRPRSEDPSCSRPAMADLLPPTAESEELLRTKRWCSKQPILVRGFVRRVLLPTPHRRHLRVVCTCGHECEDGEFRTHLVGRAHQREFFELLDQ